jgi:hypothetical protein
MMMPIPTINPTNPWCLGGLCSTELPHLYIPLHDRTANLESRGGMDACTVWMMWMRVRMRVRMIRPYPTAAMIRKTILIV